MKVFKPLQLSLQHKTYRWQGKNHLAVSFLLGFPFDDSEEVLLEQGLWQFLSQQLPDGVLDACMPKLQGEVLVYGSYYAPGSRPVTADMVQIVMGPINKSLSVIGDRYWRTLLAPTEPEHFTEMPITYEYAFGGKAHEPNPTGKGIEEVDYFGEMRVAMPNIEDANWLITSQDARPDPAGFGPLDMTWQYRNLKMGTYDENWQQNHFPGYPLDIDWTHFNTASPDQWVPEFWQGDESFQLLNMHPEKPEVTGKLPAFRTRCFVEKKIDSGTFFTEVEMRAETVFLFPAVETGVLIYRGVIEVAEDDASDIEHLLVAYEDLTQKPRSKEYYDEALRNRLDEKKVFKYMMNTKDIIPDSERCGFARMLDGVDMDGESELAKNMDARAEAEKQKALDMLEKQKQQLKEKLVAAKIDPAPLLAKLDVKEVPPDDPHLQAIIETIEKILPGSTSGDVKKIKVEEVDFSQFDKLSKQMDAIAEAKKEDARQQLRDALKNAEGTELEQQVRAQVEAALKKMDESPNLPRPQADEALMQLHNQLQQVEEEKEKMRVQGIAEDQLPQVDINLEEVEQKLKQGFEEMKAMYRQGAHYIAGKPPHKDPMDIIQYRLQKWLDKGESLAGKDLAGVDFSRRDLSGMDLSDCFLEYTNFTGCNLEGANLQRSVITHANLHNANLTDADLRDSNLGDSILDGANLTCAKLTNSEFGKANLKGACIIDCDLGKMNFLETKMAGVNFSGSIFKGSNFLELDFTGGIFIGCQMQQCNFVQSTLEKTDFTGADLSGSNFVECTLDHSKFTEANMNNTRFPGGCSLRGCNFDHANLDKVNMREAKAEDSSFEYASFQQADFGGANMQNTKFYAAVGKRAMLIKTDLGGADFSSVNLMEGSLMKARLTNANLSDSNFYAVEFLNATVGGTDFTGANLDLTKLEQWRPDRDT
mgnify:CR=1 FL=1